jgi:hypothetical protein
MKLKKIKILACCTLLLVIGCTSSRHVKTLEKGQTAVSGSIGGPLIKLFGTTLFIPFTTLEVGHGIREDITVFGGLHTTSLLFSTLQTDIGITKRWLKPDSLNRFIPGISTTLVANSMINLKGEGFDFFPELDINAYWNYRSNKSHIIYAGVGNWFDLKSNRSHNEPQTTHWIFNPHIGHNWESTNWNYNVEFKYIAPNFSNENIVVDYARVFGKKGAAGVYFGITRRF